LAFIINSSLPVEWYEQEEGVLNLSLEKKLSILKALKALRVAAIIQDLADAAITVNDLRGEGSMVFMTAVQMLRLDVLLPSSGGMSQVCPFFISVHTSIHRRQGSDYQPPGHIGVGGSALSLNLDLQELESMII
jgi:hypothetical protein